MLVLRDFWVSHTHDAQREAPLNKMIHVSFISHITIHTHAQVGLVFMNSLTLIILIHTGAQVGPYPDRTQFPSITLHSSQRGVTHTFILHK